MSAMLMVLALCLGGEAVPDTFYRPGQPLRESDINSIADSIIHQITGGKGVRVRTFGDRLIVEKDKRRKKKKEVGIPIPGWWMLGASLDGSTLYGVARWEGDPYYGYAYVYKSTDGGATWTEIDFPEDGGYYWYYTDDVESSGDGDVVAVCCSFSINQSFYISTNGGGSWSPNRSPSDLYSIGPCAMNNDGSIIYLSGRGRPASTTYMSVWKSTNYGQSWGRTDHGEAGGSANILSCSNEGKYILWSGNILSAQKTFLSTDYGASYNEVLSSETSYQTNMMDVSPSGQYMAVVKSNSEIHWSTDYGSTWSSHAFSSMGSSYVNYHACKVTDQDGEGTWRMLFTWSQSFFPYSKYTYISDDGGSSWDLLYPESAYEDVVGGNYVLECSQYAGKIWSAARNQGIAKSVDYGQNWAAAGTTSELPTAP